MLKSKLRNKFTLSSMLHRTCVNFIYSFVSLRLCPFAFYFPLSFFLSFSLLTAGPADLMKDLVMAQEVDLELHDHLPVLFNHLLCGGYFNMPSARMGKEGECGFGYADLHPYRNYNLRVQFLDRLEIYGNYRIFTGIKDPVLSDTGFGEKSDKGVNFKLALLHPEESGYILPGIAIGYEDCIGTKGFEAVYAVLTQVNPKRNLEMSLGYGKGRIQRWFGGISWMPFRLKKSSLFKTLAFSLEYDATHYRSKKWEPHPKGRHSKTALNYGLKYRAFHLLDCVINYNKGEKWAFSLSSSYNFGETCGLIPKTDDPMPYRAPKIWEPIGPLRTQDLLAYDLTCAFKTQGFEIQNLWLSNPPKGQKILYLHLNNDTWREESEVKRRLGALFLNLIPNDISEVVVVLKDLGLDIQEYRFCISALRLYGEEKISLYELAVITPMRDPKFYKKNPSCLLFERKSSLWNVTLLPKTYTFFGSASGKFKWLLGLQMAIDGFLRQDCYYSVTLGYTLDSCLYRLKAIDRLNPSQIINVRTDTVKYIQKSNFTVDEAFFQKWWNLSDGWFASGSIGLFEPAYGGIHAELLYYPVSTSFAIGIEAAYLKKRTYSGIGFTSRIRKLEGFKPTYKKFHGSQGYLSLYYNLSCLNMDLAFKAGKFLANDWGVRSEIVHTYPSGLKLFAWYTYTGAKDYVNRQRYQDHGVGISLPLDIFYSCSSRDRAVYAMSAWLRDVGATAYTGIPLYWQIRDYR